MLSLALLALLSGPLDLSPGTAYDPKVPTIKKVLGYDHGEEITSGDGFITYFKALEAASGGRAKVIEYAKTYEGRPLVMMIVGSADRIAHLDAIKADMKRLADPRGTSASDLSAIVDRSPVITWLIHGVHGNEISSGDAAMAEAYHLLAAKNDPGVATILKESLVLIDPMQNPDGRARFMFQNLQGRAMDNDSEPLSAEHDEPWPGGRSNHYLFDLNRDWLAITQPETAGRVKIFLDYFPQVTVDLHEQGGDATYYFPPAAAPRNPFRTAKQTEWLEKFGRANAAKFDERGFAYFIREIYDSFYPGYGASWPMAQGSIAHTFEQASSRGLIFRRTDGRDLTFRDGVVHHFTAAIRTAQSVAENRKAVLSDFVTFRKSASDDGGAKEYVLLPGKDPSRARRLASLLVAQGVEVFRTDEAPASNPAPAKPGAPSVAPRSYPMGSYVIPLGQPTGLLVRNLLDKDVAMDPEFLKKQEERRARLLPDQFYDITSRSLPMLFDVECVLSDVKVAGKRSAFDPNRMDPFPVKEAKLAYVIPWGAAAAAASAELARDGVLIRVADDPFSLGGRKYGTGTAVIRVAENPTNLRDTLQAVASKWGTEIVAVDSGFVDEGGISLGSNRMLPLKAPRVLLMWDSPTASLSAGWARYVLERRYNQPVSAIRISTLRRVDLRKFDVIVIPSGNYEGAISAELLGKLKDFVRMGGTLVTVGEASRWASRDSVGLLSTDTELKDGKSEDSPADAKKADAPKDSKGAFDYQKAIQAERARPDVIAGAILRGTIDQEHWMSAGMNAEMPVMVEGARVFSPIKLDRGTNVGVYAAADRLALSGILWKENKDALARKAFLIEEPLGTGHVIAFAEEPNFRAYSQASELLFMNAVLLG
ncbi:MAG: M14 family zinc carboxypeptidase, partial [Vicinamibacteria bacterium]